MARVNVGVDPFYLADQHLIAESVEITVITGGLKMHEFQIKSGIPDKFKLGTGHINFFKNKILYLKRRLEVVNDEMLRRGFKPGTHLDLNEYPRHLVNDWEPDIDATFIIRERIYERLIAPLNGKGGDAYYRYYSEKIGKDIWLFANNLLNSEIYKL